MNGFSCPSPSVGTCFSDIPRADVNDVIPFEMKQGDTVLSQVIDLDNVRGMSLCSLSGMITGGNYAPDFYRQLLFFGTYTLKFRGQTVPGWTDRPLSEIIGDPQCCDVTTVAVNCLIPDYGGLEIELDVTGVEMEAGMTPVVAIRTRFSGCECSPVHDCGCGCGGGRRIGGQ